MNKKIFIICTVRNATTEYTARLYAYADMLEEKGCEVHLPPRDTNQDGTSFDICIENGVAIQMANEVHVFYNKESQGTHFDLGVAFAMDIFSGIKKRMVMVDGDILQEGKSFPKLIAEWSKHQKDSKLYPELIED